MLLAWLLSLTACVVTLAGTFIPYTNHIQHSHRFTSGAVTEAEHDAKSHDVAKCPDSSAASSEIMQPIQPSTHAIVTDSLDFAACWHQQKLEAEDIGCA